MDGKRFSRAMQLAPDGVGGLASELGDLLVTQLCVRDQQQQEPVFLGKATQRLLNALAQFLHFQNAQGRFRLSRGGLPDRFLRIGNEVAVMPALPDVMAVVDGDAIKPGARRSFAPELVPLAIGLEKNIMRGVLGSLFGGSTRRRSR